MKAVTERPRIRDQHITRQVKRFNRQDTEVKRRAQRKATATGRRVRREATQDCELLLLAHRDGRIAARFRFAHGCVYESGGQIAIAGYKRIV